MPASYETASPTNPKTIDSTPADLVGNAGADLGTPTVFPYAGPESQSWQPDTNSYSKLNLLGQMLKNPKKLFPVIMALIVLTISIVLLINLINKAEHTVATRSSLQTPNITTPYVTSTTSVPPSSTPKVLIGNSLNDNFSTLHELPTSQWLSSSSLLSRMAANGNESFITTSPQFNNTGLVMSAVNGPDLFTGIQTSDAFASPVTVAAKVSAQISSGNPFGLFLINASGTQYVDIVGNLNPANTFYGIKVDTENGVPGYLGNTVLVSNPELNKTYTLSLTVNSSGVATAKVMSNSGQPIGSANDIKVGPGPFYVCISPI